MAHYHIAVIDSSRTYAKLLAKKTQETDYIIYNSKDGENVLCIYEPHAYPQKIQSLLHCLNVADFALFVVNSLDLDFAESAIALMQSRIKNGWIIAKDVDEDRMKELLSKSPLERWPILDAKMPIAELKAKLMENAAIYPSSPKRVLVDACFDVKGVGTVALGKAEAGKIAVHDDFEIFPQGGHTSVKSIQVQDEDVKEAELGSRVGLCLKGVSPSQLGRGSYLASAGSMQIYQNGKADLTIPDFFKEEIPPSSELFFSYGLSYISAKISPNFSLKAGMNEAVEYSLLLPIAAEPNSRFILVRANKKPRVIGYGKFQGL
jgi:selenocysteine-specific translation elongation factor